MNEIRADVTIVGGGIAGLWSAKELVNQGLSVNIVERSDMLADGATTRNEGWLHAGAYHSVAIENENELVPVTTNTKDCHRAIVNFAPESIDHGTTYALTLSDEMSHRAVSRWEQTGVRFREVSKTSISDAVIGTDRVNTVFKVEDKSVNSRVLCQKLADYASEHGVRFFTGADFRPNNANTADIVQASEKHRLVSNCFVITVGTGVKDVVERVTGRELPMRFFKAHLLVLPRLTTDNYFYLEAGEAGIMNHDRASVVGINRDGIEMMTLDQTVVPEKKQLLYDALARMLPSAVRYPVSDERIMPVACSKPDVTGVLGDTQSLDVNIFEAAPNYVCALPGKMTMAPYLAKRVAGMLSSAGSLPAIAQSPVAVTHRPADTWMAQFTS